VTASLRRRVQYVGTATSNGDFVGGLLVPISEQFSGLLQAGLRRGPVSPALDLTAEAGNNALTDFLSMSP
jgi:hypothetical protein